MGEGGWSEIAMGHGPSRDISSTMHSMELSIPISRSISISALLLVPISNFDFLLLFHL